MTRYGYRFFIAYDPADAETSAPQWDGVLPFAPGAILPMGSPWISWMCPPGWTAATCTFGCAQVPGPACTCGFTYMGELSELAWYLLSYKAFLPHPRTASRLVITRVELAGPVLEDQADGPLESRAAGMRVVEAWMPASGARFAPLIEDFYGIPVHVGSHDGAAWVRELCPDVPGVLEPLERLSPAEALELMERAFVKTPDVRAAIERARASLPIVPDASPSSEPTRPAPGLSWVLLARLRALTGEALGTAPR